MPGLGVEVGTLFPDSLPLPATGLEVAQFVSLRAAACVGADYSNLAMLGRAHRAGLGWFGKNSLLLLPGAGSWFVLGSVVTDAPLGARPPGAALRAHGDGCGSCHRCPTACPTGALVEPRGPRRPPVPGLAGAGPGILPRGVPERPSGTGSTAATSASRSVRSTGSTDRRHPPPPARGRDRVDRGRPARAPGGLRRRAAGAPTGAGTSPTRPALPAAQRPGRAGQRGGRRATPPPSAALRRWLGADDPTAGRARPWAARQLGRDDLVDHRSGDPPAGHQRLPAQGRRDPGLPVGAVAPARPRLLRRAHRVAPIPDAAGLRPGAGRPGHPHRAGARPGAGAHAAVWSAGSARPPGRVGADLVVLDPAFPLGLLGPRLGLPYAVLLHGAEVAMPGRLPGQPPAGRPRPAPQRRWPISAGGYPAAEAAPGRCGAGRCRRWWRSPPASTSTGSVPCRPASGPQARADLGLPVDGPAGGERQPARAPQGHGRAHRRGRPAPDRPVPDLTVAIAGRGRDTRPAGRPESPSTRPRSACSAGVSDADLPRLVGAADVFAMLCRNRWLGLEQEGFGIVFLEAAAAGVPQVAGRIGRRRRGGGGRGDRTGRPAPDRCRRPWPVPSPRFSTTRTLRIDDGPGVPAAGRGILRL